MTNYPKVRYFLSHVVTDTKVVIMDDIMEDHVYFEGSVADYIESEVRDEDLTLMQSSITQDGKLLIKALSDYELIE